MNKYGPSVTLKRYREDALHRKSMCGAMASHPDTELEREQAPQFAAIAARAEANLAAIDGRQQALRDAEDLLTEHRALEEISKLRTKKAYDAARRDLAFRAQELVPILLPIAPSNIGKVGVKRSITLVDEALAKLRSDDTPEAIRDEHVPVIERQLERSREADLLEDDSRTAIRVLRASLVLFKATQERERELDYADLVKLVGRVDAKAYFLPARRARAHSVEAIDDEGVSGDEDGGEDERDDGTEG